MKAVVTGASGFVAQALAANWRRKGGELVAIGRSMPREAELWSEFLQDDFSAVPNTAAALSKARPDYIFHLAGASTGTESQLFQANLMTGIVLLEAARQVCPKTPVLLVGSAAEYGITAEDPSVPITETWSCRPRGPYGISKYALTLHGVDFAIRTGMRVNVARLFNVIGAGVPKALLVGGMLDRLSKARKGGERAIKVGNVSSERDFVDVEDVAEAMIAIMESAATAQIFNVCSGRATPVKEVVETILAIDGGEVEYTVDPTFSRATDPKSVTGDGSKLAAMTGFRARRTLQESLMAAYQAAKTPA